MHYQWKKNNFSTFKTFEINRLKARNYFVPYASKEEAKGIDILDYRYKSSLVRVLNGDWDFKYYKNPNDFPNEVDIESVEFDKIDVPSCIQSRGYDIPFYTNVKYQFPIHWYQAHPTKIPTNKPVGLYFHSSFANPTKLHFELSNAKDTYNFICAYHRTFNISNLDKDYILRFFGVSNNFDLFINDEFVGYAEGSHESSEFIINQFIKEGDNDLVLVMHRWCNGTLLEDQDMFRFNGIFRDVVLYEQEKSRVWDFDLQYTRCDDKETYNWNLKVETYGYEGCSLKVTLSNDNVVYEETKACESITEFSSSLKPILWNAENPNLYKLEIELLKEGKTIEYIKKNIGFKHVEIIKDVFFLNDTKVKLKGVNHHDTNPKNGYTMSPADINLDLRLCKEYGVNCIRTSHYPPDPLLIELADIYGIYIVAEADIETHGLNPIIHASTSGRISHNLAWKDHFLDRAYRLYEPLKNDVSVIMWSLGNESGGTACHMEMYKYFKSKTTIPVHLESAIHRPIVHYDVTSMMYPSIPLIHGVGSKTLKNNDHNRKMMEVPFFMCEYAHAMGVGPGCLEEYFDEVYAYDSLMGGCIWEFADHAIYHKDGPYMYTYGGDHGEYVHDGNFCADGLFYPDRQPSSGARNMKYVYRPIRMKYIGDKKVEVFNTTNFSNASRYEITLSLIKNGENIKTWPIYLDIEPFTKQIVEISEIEEAGDCFLNVHYQDKNDSSVFFDEQLILHVELPEVSIVDSSLGLIDSKEKISVEYSKGNVVFDKKSGSISTYTYNSKNMIQSSEHSLMRVKLDNDAYECMLWNITGMTGLKSHLKSIKSEKDGDVAIIKTKTKLSKRFKSFTIDDEYKVHGDGTIEVTSTLHKKGNTVLPRFSTMLHLDDTMKNVEYVAREQESYNDFCNHTEIGRFESHINKMMEPNIRPQETGNRTDAREVFVNDGVDGLLFKAVEQPFEFSLKRVPDSELKKMGHREDVEKYNESHLTISKFNMGVGTGICGPVALPKYRFKSNQEYVFKYTIQPKSK